MENWGKQIGVTKHVKWKACDGFQKLVQRWRKCIEVRGDFVEKYLCSFENNRCKDISFLFHFKYLFPFIFYLSGGKTYQPATVRICNIKLLTECPVHR